MHVCMCVRMHVTVCVLRGWKIRALQPLGNCSTSELYALPRLDNFLHQLFALGLHRHREKQQSGRCGCGALCLWMGPSSLTRWGCDRPMSVAVTGRQRLTCDSRNRLCDLGANSV